MARVVTPEIRRAERIALAALIVATCASLAATGIVIGAIGAALGWWS